MRTTVVNRLSGAGLLALALAAPGAHASCGAAFCMVNTSWNVQGAWTEPGLRLDLRYEYLDQDQPRSGSGKVGVGQISQHHDEVRTVNRNWLATADYTANRDWGVAATLPLLDRSHAHIHNHHGQQIWDSWNFTRVGDLRVLGRRQWHGESLQAQRLDSWGMSFGMKLPTGDFRVRNAEGELAERSLQPGTGTADVLFGGFFRSAFGSGASWFADAVAQLPIESRDQYKPGNRIALDLGYRRELGERLAVMLQLNALHKERDRGAAAEPADSGGRFLFASPGFSWVVAKNVQLYAFLQLPLYQYVNGVQLTADWAAVAGLSTRF